MKGSLSIIARGALECVEELTRAPLILRHVFDKFFLYFQWDSEATVNASQPSSDHTCIVYGQRQQIHCKASLGRYEIHSDCPAVSR